MGGLQKIRDAVDRFVVDQDRAEQRLLCLEIVRRRAEDRSLGLGPRENQRIARAPQYRNRNRWLGGKSVNIGEIVRSPTTGLRR